jgi:transcriptional regulator with XRE-family HTH domain
VVDYNERYTRNVDKSPSVKLGKNIRRIREERSLSQGDICRAVGLDRAQMSNIESGKGNPTLATIEKIATALGVTSGELLK